MPQYFISRGPAIAELQQVARAEAAICHYENSWGYAEPKASYALPGNKSLLWSAEYAAAPLDLEDCSERLAELAAAQHAVAAAASACQQYSATMAYAEQGRAEHKASSTTTEATLGREDFADRLQELVRTAQGALSAAAAAVEEYACAMGYAAPGLTQCKPGGAASPDSVLLGRQDFSERLAELLRQVAAVQAVAAFNDSVGYSQPALGRAEQCKAAPADSLDTADFAERLEELVARAAAASPIADCWQYAEPGCAGRRAVPAATTVMDLADMAERLAELVACTPAAAASVPDCWQYAGPGHAQRKAAAFTPTPTPLELADMAERLAELTQCSAPAVPDCWQYAEPGRPQRKAATFTPTPLDPADIAERLAELTQCSAPAVPDCWQYAEPGRVQRKAVAAFTPTPLDPADIAERLAELTQCSAPAVPDCWQYAEPGRAQRKAVAAFTPAPLDPADMAERLVELELRAAPAAALVPAVPDLCYAKPERCMMQRKAAAGFATGGVDACLGCDDFAERLQELTARA